ncbi:glycoside hydrolase family 16 protein [Planomonospora venezuelensis]|uniref:Beta-glucanase (GH16 family) n=1 Tax=Planomonospora venezuelensis TaxID=1999 RepID=A0A841D9Z5_PLAVE|nr:glycoside hydrolase family 16 protein [Planomonospora venezuelensis]MBB5966810.1 beta-glucanase (GH16 family) [Planomonospora venezuelensis]GIN01686.1 hydrolase [Planomonospora venezuelensis]
MKPIARRTAAVAAVLAAAALTAPLRPAEAGGPLGPAGREAAAARWKLSWHDEFDGRKGARPSGSRWVHDLGGEPRWGNQEWQYYTDRAKNASLDGRGRLAVTARRERLPGMAGCLYGTCDITSARITTRGRFSQAYGRFEARIKVPAGQGVWPAFWMMGDDADRVGWPHNGEIDVMEVIGRHPGTVFGGMHGPGFPFSGVGGRAVLPGGARFADDFHVFAVEWSPGKVTWLLDGRPYFTARRSGLQAGSRWVFDHPFHLLLNVAVGGTWPGPPGARTRFPATMLVDYVRVYTRR